MFKTLTVGFVAIASQSMAYNTPSEKNTAMRQKKASYTIVQAVPEEPEEPEFDSCMSCGGDIAALGSMFLKSGSCPSCIDVLTEEDIIERKQKRDETPFLYSWQYARDARD